MSHTLLLVDDQPEFLRLARDRLTRVPELAVVGSVTSGEDALQLIPKLETAPDAVLLDVEMPGLDGFETAKRLRTLAPAVRIILTSASNSRGYSHAATAIGAAFLPKRDLSSDAILRLIG